MFFLSGYLDQIDFSDFGFPLQIAAAFIAALVCGMVASFLHMPRVVGYIVGGLLLGPDVLRVFSRAESGADDPFRPAVDLALAIVMLSVGATFYFPSVKRLAKSVLGIAAFQSAATFALVGLLTYLALDQASCEVPLMLGILAIEIAPATTLLVMREYQSEGSVTKRVLILIGVVNLLCIVAFQIAFYGFMNIVEHDVHPGLIILKNLGVGALLGFVGAFLLVFAYERLAGKERAAAFFAVLFGTVACCEYFELPTLLAFLSMGIVLTNICDFGKEILDQYDGIAKPLYVMFFVIAGSQMHVEELLHLSPEGMLLMGLYIFGRFSGKIVGAWFGAKITDERASIRRFVGPALLSQAGLAIGLAYECQKHSPELGNQLLSIVLPSIIFFEVLGPLGVRFAVLRAGEVKMLALLETSRVGARPETLLQLVRKLLTSLGILKRKVGKKTEDIVVEDIMRKSVPTLRENSRLEGILDFFENYHLPVIPVIDAEGWYLGVITQQEIKELLYDPMLNNLVIALELTRDEDPALSPDISASDALSLLARAKIEAAPVVMDAGDGRKKLVGYVDQRDIISLFGRDLAT
ncbi:MAG: cation:proton antiporter [Planctomycetes bacterium]|nr:cation:proton antiporter [Planctomycetota bacterium]